MCIGIAVGEGFRSPFLMDSGFQRKLGIQCHPRRRMWRLMGEEKSDLMMRTEGEWTDITEGDRV